MHPKPDLFQIMLIYHEVFSLFMILKKFSYDTWTEYWFSWWIDPSSILNHLQTELGWLTKNIQTLFTGIDFLIAGFNNWLEKPFTHQNRDV